MGRGLREEWFPAAHTHTHTQAHPKVAAESLTSWQARHAARSALRVLRSHLPLRGDVWGLHAAHPPAPRHEASSAVSRWVGLSMTRTHKCTKVPSQKPYSRARCQKSKVGGGERGGGGVLWREPTAVLKSWPFCTQSIRDVLHRGNGTCSPWEIGIAEVDDRRRRCQSGLSVGQVDDRR